MKVLKQVLEERSGSHVLPFLWMKGEDNNRIKEELDRIEDCGVREICLESRPHPDFCGPGWWENLDFIMAEARKRTMRVWILDDDKFPTGHANGAFETTYPERSKCYLAERHMDIMGPCRNHAVLVENFLGADGTMLGILAFPKPDGDSLAVSSEGVIDLTGQYQDGFVYFDLPEGAYRLFVLFTTRKGGGRAHYMNLLDPSSVQVLIEAVYETHYQRYGKYFGKEFAGFFSDEPELGNVPGYPFDCKLGQKDIRLPWSGELELMLKTVWGQCFLSSIPLLWYDGGEETKSVRYTYMDQMTKLVRDCFSGQIGRWCEEHQVEYIGHILEDDNSHARMGCGTGHYFREMAGQHMAGIDVVHHQIVPGFTEKVHQWIAGDTDGEFFHFGLAKLGSSAAHIDPGKKNRALCEIFGNYGWAEGMPLMRWLTDHMLVRGINRFTPHAFSMEEYDRDCPPHFYAGGKNPQFGCFAQLMKYMNRAAFLLSEGHHVAQAAVLYHGEMEWAAGQTGLFQKPVRALMERQLDCDVIPADVLAEGKAEVIGGCLRIHEETYVCLIVPGCSVLPDEAAEFIVRAAADGLPIYFADELPERKTGGGKLPQEFYQSVCLIPLENIADQVEALSDLPVRVITHDKGLRLYTVRQKDGYVSMIFNERVAEELLVTLEFCTGQSKSVMIYDAWNNRTERYLLEGQRISLRLLPGNSLYLCRADVPESASESAVRIPVWESAKRLPVTWNVERCRWGEETFEPYVMLDSDDILPNLNGLGYEPGFTGTYGYTGEFIVLLEKEKRYMLQFREVSDTMRLTINGYALGYQGMFPARMDVTNVLKDGINEIRLEITTTLVWSRKDGASTHLQIPSSGLGRQPLLEVYRS